MRHSAPRGQHGPGGRRSACRKSLGTYEEFGDALKEQVVRAEPNIALFLNTHAFAVAREGNTIASVAIAHGTTPRGVYEQHWGELDELLKLPGSTRQPRR